jgi:outer membrane protein assembly factor BamB
MVQQLKASLILLTAVSTLAAGPDDWPQFRGPTGQGVAQDGPFPTDWGTTRNIAWMQAIPGTGWSSPIIYQERVYLTTAVGVKGTGKQDQSLRALCLDTKTGKTIWEVEVFRLDGSTAAPVHSKNSHASPTPLTDGQRLYVHFGHEGTGCLDLDGNILWKNNNLNYNAVHGSGGSPILADDAMVFNCDGLEHPFVVALNRTSGKVLWKTERQTDCYKKFSFSTPLLITVNGKKQIISPGSGAVCAYEPATGREVWRVGYGEGYSIVPRPVYGHGLVFICTGFESPTLLAIRPDGQGDVTSTHVVWTGQSAAPLTPSSLLVGDEIYLISDNGIASCLDARTGRLHWKERLGGNYSASPIAADGKIYFQSEEGDAVAIKAGKKFDRLAKNALAEKTLASYAASDGALYIRTEKHLYKIQEQPKR